jgi:DNA topoisomerase I
MDRSTRRAAPAVAGASGASLPAGASPELVYVSDALPGIRRIRRGRGFVYRTSDGHWLRDAGELARIRRLAIPPAYTSVWICPLPDGHLQATGRDARGRKQYRYHPRWRELREADKYDRLEAFGRALPRIRASVARDLRHEVHSGVSRELVLAAIVRLLDTTCLRVGNDEYARANASYGLTTLHNRHAAVRAGRLALRFRGKGGVMQEATLADPRVARVVRRCQHMPGQELFQYSDADGVVRDVGSADVNDYLCECTGARFTAKDFRTWHATVLALELMRLRCAGSPAQRFDAKEVIAEVARRLGNSAAVCRKSYIHPAVLELGSTLAAREANLAPLWSRIASAHRSSRGLHAAEQRLLKFLRSGNDP